MNIEEEIIFAIQNKKSLIVNYKNEPENRIIEPHMLGLKNGNKNLSAYQSQGYSTSGEKTTWKYFHIKYIHIIQEEKNFNIRKGYNPKPNSKMFDKVIAQV